MQIQGIEGLTRADLERELAAGARFVFYEYCISLLLFTLRRPSRVFFVRTGDGRLVRGLPYSLLSMVFGWWGLPWGMIYTPLALITNFGGGCDITAHLLPLVLRGREPLL